MGRDERLWPLPNSLRVLDLCTGSGCIPLLFARVFPFEKAGVQSLRLHGVDISPTAIELARVNQRNVNDQYENLPCLHDFTRKPVDHSMDTVYQRIALSRTKFLQADIFSKPDDNKNGRPNDLWTALIGSGIGTEWDVLISNPPYISPKHFYTTTTRSVRNFEPKLALVPPPLTPHLTDEQQGDLFYPRLLHLAELFKSKILLMEVADLDQAERIAALATMAGIWSGVEIWCDDPGLPQQKSKLCDVPVLGQGNGRSVFCWRKR